MFLNSYWYLAAWSDELSTEPLGIVLLKQPIVLFRRSDGTPAALEDRCCHRRAPLSIGKVVGDCIRCGYHGLVYDAAGNCVRIPGQAQIPSDFRIRTYPVIERHRCIWVWMGEATAADPDVVPEFSWLDAPGWMVTKRHAHIRCDYRLVIDNLLDLSHLAYVHGSTVGQDEVADAAEVTTQRKGDRVRVARWTYDVPPAKTYAEFGSYRGNIDRWQISEFRPPSTLIIDNGSADAGSGAPEGKPGTQRWGFIVCHGITPETETTTNYFWALAHNFDARTPEFLAEFHRQCQHVVGEDIAIFTAQQRIIDLDPSAPQRDIRYDAGPLQARRIIDQLLAAQDAREEESLTEHSAEAVHCS
jgi:phenylpropionate dioxygenase-like ring-hydroxylating dioxygenase large terminal subunit